MSLKYFFCTFPTYFNIIQIFSNEEENEASRAVSDLMSGRFRWFLRKRLRITLIGDKRDIAEPPHELHSQQMQGRRSGAGFLFKIMNLR